MRSRPGSKFSCAWALPALLALGGCTPWWKDRWADLGDPFRVAVVQGGGVGASVGPFGAGVGYIEPAYGWIDGEWRARDPEKGLSWGRQGAVIDLAFLRVEATRRLDRVTAAARGKSEFLIRTPVGVVRQMGMMRDRQYELDRVAPAEAWSELRFGVAAVIGVDLGFNAGELLDFVLGFAGVDLYGDDLHSTMDRRLSVRVSSDDQDPTSYRPAPFLVIGDQAYCPDEHGLVITETLDGSEVAWGWFDDFDVPRGQDPWDYVDWQGTLRVGDHDQTITWSDPDAR